jgi:hypothetical protein
MNKKVAAFSQLFCLTLLILLLVSCSNSKAAEQAGLPTLVPSLRPAEPSSESASATEIPATEFPATDGPTAEPAVILDIDPPAQITEPIRINLAPGAISETIEGIIEAPNRDGYLFQVLAGQEVTVKLSSPDGLANFELSGLKDGQPYKRMVNEEVQWTGIAPQTQDYRLDVSTAQETSPYLLTVTILTMEEPAGEVQPLMYSADGQWQVLATISAPEPVSEEEIEQFPTGQKYHAVMEVSRVDGSQSWTAVDEWRSWGVGYTYPDVLKWSSDGQTLFFTNVPVPDGCSLFVNGGDLWRLDLDTGEIAELLPFVGLVLALSPDDTQLAYFGSYGKGMTLNDLATGNEQPIELPSFGDAWDIGGLMWSPGGRHLLLTQVIPLIGPCSQETKTAVIRVDIDTLLATPLIEPGQGDFALGEWLADDTIRLAGQDGAKWILNIVSGELSPDAAGDTPQG